MKYAQIPGIDKPISRLLQGSIMLSADDRDGNFRLLDACFENGFNAFDSAHSYGAGLTDTELGAWIQSRGIRDEVAILGKCAHPENGIRDRVRPEYIRRDLAESLERLQTDAVELFLLHRDSREYPVGEIVDVLHEAKEAGQIGVYGGSNWLADRVKAANDYAAANGKTPFTVSSPQFSVAEMVKPAWEGCISVSGAQGEADRAYYKENEISLFTWSSLAGGFMTGKFSRDNLDSFTEYWDTNPIEAYAYENNFKRLDRVIELAADKGLSPAQISVAYVLSNNPRYHAIVANWATEQVPDNAAAADIQLSAAEIAWLELKMEEKPA
ncbi:MAG: aldo/keto reductase [Chloroflexota bacterium]|nr:aldo/keto reductase [Chloroflexota bacterium]MDE2948546.1 aldo/keto reductase [Chloroflexota bacterium]